MLALTIGILQIPQDVPTEQRWNAIHTVVNHNRAVHNQYTVLEVQQAGERLEKFAFSPADIQHLQSLCTTQYMSRLLNQRGLAFPMTFVPVNRMCCQQRMHQVETGYEVDVYTMTGVVKGTSYCFSCQECSTRRFHSFQILNDEVSWSRQAKSMGGFWMVSEQSVVSHKLLRYLDVTVVCV